MLQPSSLKRDKVSEVEKIGKRNIQESKERRVVKEGRGRRGMEDSGRIPERPDTPFRGRLHRCCGTTAMQKLGKNLLTVFIFSFQ